MSAKKKIAKLEKKIRKLRTKYILTRSDLQIELESEMYRANLAENRVRNLSDELYAIKAQLAILQRVTPKQPNTLNAVEKTTSELLPPVTKNIEDDLATVQGALF
jgi:predicted  nucleic acid-binding Zn-ribbon protein